MTASEQIKTTPAGRAGNSGKQAGKKRELALHTLAALSELGFARLNLREVAARSGASLGSIHYYFSDKAELLAYCLRLYKEGFVAHLDELIDGAGDLATLVRLIPDALAEAIEQHGPTHRLWYDVRAQAMFDPAFRPVVDEIESQLIDVAGRFLARARALGSRNAAPDALDFYLMLDAWFRYGLQQRLGGNADAGGLLRSRLRELEPLFAPTPG